MNVMGWDKGVLATGLEFAKRYEPDVVVTLDGDNQHDPSEIPRLVRPILDGEADIVIGSRLMGNNKMPRLRYFFNIVLSALTCVACRKRLIDTQSGFRAYSRRALDLINITESGFGVDSQIVIDTYRRLRFTEVPITTTYHEAGLNLKAFRQFIEVVLAILRSIIRRMLRGEHPGRI